MNVNKSGPIHFYVTYERSAELAAVVEYCVQIGERQPLNRSQACYLVGSGEVKIDGRVVRRFGEILPNGTWQIDVRGKTHHVVVHGAVKE